MHPSLFSFLVISSERRRAHACVFINAHLRTNDATYFLLPSYSSVPSLRVFVPRVTFQRLYASDSSVFVAWSIVNAVTIEYGVTVCEWSSVARMRWSTVCHSCKRSSHRLPVSLALQRRRCRRWVLLLLWLKLHSRAVGGRAKNNWKMWRLTLAASAASQTR